eukprot:scaffold1605_cov158-Amphora_coffeaeformis.AAC.19
MLLPPGMVAGQHNRILTYEEMKPGPIDITQELEKNEEQEDVPLVSVASHSENELVATVSDDEDCVSSGSDEESKRRRVHFDDTVQVSTFVKTPIVYPKTPPRHKKSPAVKEENEDMSEKSTPRTRRSTPKKKPTEITLTPRRMSLRSASKLARKEADVTTEGDTQTDPTTPSRSVRRRSTTTKSAQKRTEESAGVENTESPKMEPSVSTPSRNTRRSLSQSPAADVVSKKATKMDKLKALNLLSKVPKSVQSELQKPLERIEIHGKDMPEHLQLLVADFPATGELIHFLCEYPTLVNTVLTQLRIRSSGN